MTEVDFFNALKEHTSRQPFLPFLVELVNGQRIIIDYPSVAFSGDSAGFLSATDGLIEFSCDEVREISLAKTESAA